MAKKKSKSNIFLSVLLIIGMISSCFTSLAVTPAVTAEAASDHAYRYFYDQLDPAPRKIYDAMYEMYTTGVFEKGEDFSLSDHGYVTESQLASFAAGDQQLLNDYGAARDAFQNDYPDCFYVDFSLLSIRVTQDAQKNLHGYLGKGRSTTYFQKGFTADNVKDRISKYEEKIGEIVAEAEAVKVGAHDNETAMKAGAVHDYLVKHMIYHFENEVTDKTCNARTAYDGIVCGEGVCEAYTRSFKAVLDRLDIPCVNIMGVYRPNDKVNESHIWNAVQVDGKWYGVDVTHDDPTNKEWVDKNSGHESRENFLVGQLSLSADHFSTPIMSSANYEFDYPVIENNALTEEYMADTGDEDLKVKVVKESYFDDWEPSESDSGGIYCVSYRGKNYTENEADGYFLLCKYYTYAPGTDEWTVSEWSYLDPECYIDESNPEELQDFEPTQTDPEMGDIFRLAMPMVKKAQFAVTTIAPSYYYLEGQDRMMDIIFNRGLYYKGNPSLLHTISPEIENEWGNYVAPPYTTSLTPYQAGQLMIGKTYHMEWKFDDKLIPNGIEDFDIELAETKSSGGDFGSSTGKIYSKIENKKHTGDSIIEFDFTPSEQFADDFCFYTFKIKGLMGEKSLKAPIPVTYCACYPCSAYAYTAQGYDWNVYAKPQLLETSDLDTSEWEDSQGDGVDITDQLTHRLTLVTTSTNPGEEEQMKEVLENSQYADDFSKAQVTNTYNIRLSLCKAMVVKTGQGVRISLGFPAGTCYEDFAETGRLEFKAYHYIVDPVTNLFTGEVEEIPITVTPLGLILTVDSFSPFAVAAIPGTGHAPTNKTLIVTSSENGRITDEDGTVMRGEDGIIEFTPDTTMTFTVKSDGGFDIDGVTLNEVPQEVENDKAQTITLSYNDLPEVSNYLNANMIATSIHEDEVRRGETHTFANLLPATITFSDTDYILEPGEALDITPEIDLHSGDASATYQWYKDGQVLDGKTAANLNINPVVASDSGTYTLKVKTEIAGETVESTSEEIEVTVQETVLNVPGSLELKLTDSYQFKDLVTPKGKTVTFESSEKDIADVDAAGNLTLKQTGRTDITVRAGSKDAVCHLTVTDPDVTGITLDAKDIVLNIGEKRTLSVASHEPENAQVKSTTWSAENNDGVVEVDPVSGEVTAKKGGTADVKATVNGNVEAVCKVTVRESLRSVKLSQTELTLKVNHSQKLDVITDPVDAYAGTITWRSTNDASATVDQTGLVKTTAVPGKADITASVAGQDVLTCHVTVLKEPVTGFGMAANSSDTSVRVGSTATPYRVVNITPSGATYTTVKWSTDTPSIIAVNAKTGAVTGLDIGTGILRATVDDMTKTASIRVYREPVTSVNVSPNVLELTEGDEETLTAEVLPNNASYKDVTWTSDESGIADVDDQGRVTAVSAGHTTIRATADGITGTCEVTVNKKVTPLNSISLDTDELTLKVNESHDFAVTYDPVNADHGEPVWSVKEGSIAQITQSGHLTAKEPGDATVTVEVDGKTAECHVIVEKEPVQSVTISEKEISIVEGTSHQLSAEVYPDNATYKTITWSSDSASIARVDAHGKVTGVAEGDTYIRATADGVEAACHVTVSRAAIPLDSISLDKEQLTIKVNDTHDFVLTFHPEHADHGDAVWAIDNEQAAEIDQTGHLTAKAPGSAKVTVRVDGQKAECAVTVEKVPVRTIDLSEDNLSLAVDTSHKLKATVLPASATYKDVSWSTDDKKVATVSDDGTVTAVAVGDTDIIAEADGVEAVCHVSVHKAVHPLESVSLDTSDLTLKTGGSHSFTVSFHPDDAEHGDAVWSVDNADIAEITQSGKLTAHAVGTAKVTVNVDGHKAVCNVTVEKEPVQSVTLSDKEISLAEGTTHRLTADVKPANATYKNVSWSSDNTGVASVDEHGNVTANSAGETTIYASADGVKASCHVIVHKAAKPLSGISLDTDKLSLKATEQHQFVVSYQPADAEHSDPVWSVKNPDIVDISAEGLLTAKAVGETDVVVEVDGIKASCHVTVEKLPVEQIELSRTEAEVAVGHTTELFAEALPMAATYRDITWSSDDPSIANVSEYGIVTGVAVGNTVVRASADGVEAQCAVEVLANEVPVEDVSLEVNTITMNPGDSHAYTLSISPAHATYTHIFWSSSNEDVAVVDDLGYVTAKGVGTAFITVTVDGRSFTCEVRVEKVPVAQVVLSQSEASIEEGGTLTLTASVSPENATEKTVTWSSSDSGIASVDGNGNVTAVKAGEAVITASADGVDASCKITVTAKKAAEETPGTSGDSGQASPDPGQSKDTGDAGQSGETADPGTTTEPAGNTGNNIKGRSSSGGDDEAALYSGNGKGVKTGDNSFLYLSILLGAAFAVSGTVLTKRRRR